MKIRYGMNHREDSEFDHEVSFVETLFDFSPSGEVVVNGVKCRKLLTSQNEFYEHKFAESLSSESSAVKSNRKLIEEGGLRMMKENLRSDRNSELYRQKRKLHEESARRKLKETSTLNSMEDNLLKYNDSVLRKLLENQKSSSKGRKLSSEGASVNVDLDVVRKLESLVTSSNPDEDHVEPFDLGNLVRSSVDELLDLDQASRSNSKITSLERMCEEYSNKKL
jgi:hypothetical protein